MGAGGARIVNSMGDQARPVLRAATTAAFAVGLLLLFLNPPSFSGAGGLALIAAGAIVLLLVTAWATASLMGGGAEREREFERLVRRSEELAKEPYLAAAATEFELLVAHAIDRLPDEFRKLLEDTPVVVSQHGAEHRAYGHYFGDTIARRRYEDRIVLYQDTLERDFGHDPGMLADQVERVLKHELAHHLGWGERGVRELGL
jgi:predicted Zn-dependent protease with MMP-like domain